MQPRRITGLLTRELPDGETVVLTPDRSLALVLNPMGSAIWQLCDGRRSAREIAAFIEGVFPEAGLERISSDIGNLLAELREARLVEDAADTAVAPGGA